MRGTDEGNEGGEEVRVEEHERVELELRSIALLRLVS